MLQLKNIKKSYKVGDNDVMALKGINLQFRKKEFVSILGPSGCGKTTTLNIVGGLDKYSDGDLLIDGKSTKHFTDSNWDAYRNNTIGFVFQNYNLISHLTVLDNVAIALTLLGVGMEERKNRAIKALTEVGLESHLHKKPNQLSGGQMQRVAIARALVNEPKILLADEPTGALDSTTSVQIMELIKKISGDRLVIMVTHNNELADQYSDRIIKLSDGNVIEDSNPYDEVNQPKESEKMTNKKTSMSFLTALKLSFNNLRTKKVRTMITASAGSIGIIGVSLVLAIRSGMTDYINVMQKDTLAGFPISVSAGQTYDFSAGGGGSNLEQFPDDGLIHPYDPTSEIGMHMNNLTQEYFDYLDKMDSNLYDSIAYSRGIEMNGIFKKSDSYELLKINEYLNEIPDNRDFIESQYDLLAGSYPTSSEDIVLIVDSQNRVSIDLLEKLGINSTDAFKLTDLIDKEIKIVHNDQYYFERGNGTFGATDPENSEAVTALYESTNSKTLKLTSIMRVKDKDSAISEILSNGLGYTVALTDEMLDSASQSKIVVAQKASPDINVITGQEFSTDTASTNTYKNVMLRIGGDTTPVGVQIYPTSYDARDKILKYLDDYNIGRAKEDQILYMDIAGVITTVMSTLINTIAIVLAAFSGISLFVSSIMIGIITYVSVVERTKEIGILRSIGARKKDISRVFNAETIIVGFTAGVLGIAVTLLISIPLNIIVKNLINVNNIVNLTWLTAVILIIVSIALTFIAGLFPSSIASRRDPVIALRSE